MRVHCRYAERGYVHKMLCSNHMNGRSLIIALVAVTFAVLSIGVFAPLPALKTDGTIAPVHMTGMGQHQLCPPGTSSSDFARSGCQPANHSVVHGAHSCSSAFCAALLATDYQQANFAVVGANHFLRANDLERDGTHSFRIERPPTRTS